jgi:hypothetical protein
MYDKFQGLIDKVDVVLEGYKGIPGGDWVQEVSDRRSILNEDGKEIAKSFGATSEAIAVGDAIASIPGTVEELREIRETLVALRDVHAPLKAPLSEDSMISGAKFEEFYRNHFPSGWIIEDLPFTASDDKDRWVMDPEEMRPFSWFGYAEIHGSPSDTAGPNLIALFNATDHDRAISLATLYEAVYADKALEAVPEINEPS